MLHVRCPKTFQKSLTDYLKQEEKLLKVIYRKYLGSALSLEEDMKLKSIDNDLLWYDLKYLLGETQQNRNLRSISQLTIQYCRSKQWKRSI